MIPAEYEKWEDPEPGLQALRDGVVVLQCVYPANTFRLRLQGLLGATQPVPGEGLLICPCHAVHTLGMRYPIDVAFLNHEGVVISTVHGLRPWRWATARGAWQVLEMRAGTLAEHGIRASDLLQLKAQQNDG